MTNVIKRTIKHILFTGVCKFLLKLKQPMYKDPSVGMVSLLCHQDVAKYIYTIYSFFYQLHFQLPLYIVDDGTLTQKDKDTLRMRFAVHIDDVQVSQTNIARMYQFYPYLFRNRFKSDSHIYKMKIDALVLSPFQRTILIDSDVLFFRKPKTLIKWIGSNSNEILHFIHKKKTIHKGVFTSQLELTCRILLKKYAYPHMNVDFNSGLVCIPNKSIVDLRVLNSIFRTFFSLKIEEDLIVTEEIALSILCGDHSANQALNPKQYIVSALNIDYSPDYRNSAVCIHYAASSTDKLYKDALINTFKQVFC
jgi:hypothetical protein